MPWYPKARHHNVRRDQNRRITPVRINHHTAVTNAQHLDGQAGNLKQAYPHFMIGRDGQVVQYQDTSFMARADLDGNNDTISIETWDGYPGGAPGHWKHNSDVPPWTDAQVRAIVDLDAWLLEQHPSIPRRLARDSRPGASSHGLSWHRLGCDGNFPTAWPYHGRLSGGIRYSTARGKVCPGDRRITQLVEVIYPALADVKVGGLTVDPSKPPTYLEVLTAMNVYVLFQAGGTLATPAGEYVANLLDGTYRRFPNDDVKNQFVAQLDNHKVPWTWHSSTDKTNPKFVAEPRVFGKEVQWA